MFFFRNLIPDKIDSEQLLVTYVILWSQVLARDIFFFFFFLSNISACVWWNLSQNKPCLVCDRSSQIAIKLFKSEIIMHIYDHALSHTSAFAISNLIQPSWPLVKGSTFRGPNFLWLTPSQIRQNKGCRIKFKMFYSTHVMYQWCICCKQGVQAAWDFFIYWPLCPKLRVSYTV